MSFNNEGREGVNNKFDNFCTQDNNFNDNDLAVGGSVAGNNDQEITANIRGEEDRVDFNDEGGKGKNKEFDSLFNHDDDDTDIDREGVGVLLVTMIQRWQ